ncbi:MAG TPA: toprim domain-containing protein [Allosphingosinicella sp.]|jgi:putative DNA primase/helicase|uniref:toprim domain-containing protein n=1 Tax=Allosphingosinicella sp. TaxID=2823234 RepID=UPI002F292B8D
MTAEPVADFLSAMEQAGVRPVEPIAQQLGGGKLIRFRSEGDKSGRRNGWAVLYLDGKPAGAFGSYRLGVREKWSGSGNVLPLSPAEYRARQQQWQQEARRRHQERQEGWEATAGNARARWDSAGPVAASHAYLVRKGLAGEGLRQEGHRLLVPMHDLDGRLWNLQSIAPDGSKLFMKGGRQSGLACIIGNGGGRLCLGEGWATMAAVRSATGYPVAAAFSAENLARVATDARKHWPKLDLVICADDDPHLVRNPKIRKNVGRHYAAAAARAVGGRLAVPLQEAG